MPDKKTKISKLDDLLAKFLIKNSENFFYWKKTSSSINFEFSENIKTLTGYTSEQINRLPGSFFSLIFSDDFDNFKKLYFASVDDSGVKSIKIEHRIITKNNKPFWVENNIFIKRYKRKTEIVGFVYLIDEIKQKLDNSIKFTEELKEYNTIKDNFFSIISHDLRSPFTSILGFSEILLNEPELKEEERTEFLRFIFDSSLLQMRLINNLLDWSRLEIKSMKTDIVKLPVRSAIFNSVSNLTAEAVRKNIEVVTLIEPQLYVKTDEILFNKILVNLLENAIKFSNTNSSINILAKFYNDDFVEFIVKDNGIGITEINKEKIFKLDKKFSTTGTQGEKGTGTGLVITKKIINYLGGDIWFYSTPGQGSEFHFILPQISDSFFVVSERAEIKNLIIETLKKEYPSIKMYSFQNGFECIEKLREVVPIVVLTENKLTLMDGVTLIREISKVVPRAKIHYGIISDSAAVIQQDLFNISFVLQYPFTKEQLIENVRRTITR